MKTFFAIRLLLFLFTSLITVNVIGQPLPDPGNDPIRAVDSVVQTSDVKSLHLNLKEARTDTLSKSHLPQLGNTLPYAAADNQEKKQR